VASRPLQVVRHPPMALIPNLSAYQVGDDRGDPAKLCILPR
jgi:hypothetical protein